MDAEEFVDSFFDMDVDQCISDILKTSSHDQEQLIREYGEEVYYTAIKRIKQ